MASKKALEATDDLERKLLLEISGLGDDGRKEAAALLGVSRDVLDHMWAASESTPKRREMRLHEARKLADWLGYDIELRKREPLARQRLRASGDR